MLSSFKSIIKIRKLYSICFFNMSTSNAIKRYYLIRYNYAADGYYRRLGEIKKHEKAIESFKTKFNTVVICSHFFPYTGRLYLFETEAEQSEVEKYINSDPYIKNRKIVSDFEIKEFDIDSVRKFNSISSDFLQRY